MMETKIQKVAKELSSAVEKFVNNHSEVDAYQFEQGLVSILRSGNQQLMQAAIGDLPQGENTKVKILTTVGELTVPKCHPMSVRPMGFGISPCLQEHMCRVGSKMVYAEAGEEFSKFLDIDISDKQIERVCHCYGEQLEKLDWANAYSDSIQMKISCKNDEPVYVMVDGSMILTREEKWKEIKVGRVFGAGSQVEISKGRKLLDSSVYSAHLGSASDFWERFSVEIPPSEHLVFINDGAIWIWKYIQECYPNSIQILDFFHCKEHICQFSKVYFKHPQEAAKFSEEFSEMLLNSMVDQALEKLKKLEPKTEAKGHEKEKLLGYLQANRNRIDYGRFKEMGLLIGSGAIESAHRDIVQKRLKLSGQRWTSKGAQQVVNIRVYHKSNKWNTVIETIRKAA